MNTLHIDTGREMRGGQLQVLLLLKLLRDRGLSVELLSPPGSLLAQRAWQELGLKSRPPTLRRIFEQSARFDLVHAHDARAHSAAAIASRRPFVVSRRVAFPVRTGLVSRWKYSKPARYLAVSRFVARRLEEAGVEPNRIDIVYDAVEQAPPGIWDPTAPAVAMRSDDPGKAQALVEESGRLAGVPVVFSTDLARDLRRASMFIYLSHSEGLGSAALLAMHMGIPVIASRVGGLAEVFEHEVSGLYVENAAEEAARAMRRMAGEAALAPRLIEAAHRRVQTLFSADQLIEGSLLSYRRALDS